ncbi:titin-like isoform X2 [Branchiostoma floridae]|uniref:glycogenin glucosyltransferase n=1 Tax=Branchiostoma floridae TaxID=7739 RepID=A0A9J7M153_BRAFL|nr:titin-like isoform X2 [Branchiostoma floridae]
MIRQNRGSKKYRYVVKDSENQGRDAGRTDGTGRGVRSAVSGQRYGTTATHTTRYGSGVSATSYELPQRSPVSGTVPRDIRYTGGRGAAAGGLPGASSVPSMTGSWRDKQHGVLGRGRSPATGMASGQGHYRLTTTTGLDVFTTATGRSGYQPSRRTASPMRTPADSRRGAPQGDRMEGDFLLVQGEMEEMKRGRYGNFIRSSTPAHRVGTPEQKYTTSAYSTSHTPGVLKRKATDVPPQTVRATGITRSGFSTQPADVARATLDDRPKGFLSAQGPLGTTTSMTESISEGYVFVPRVSDQESQAEVSSSIDDKVDVGAKVKDKPTKEEDDIHDRDIAGAEAEDKTSKKDDDEDGRDIVGAKDEGKPTQTEEIGDDRVGIGAKIEDKPTEVEETKDPSSPHKRSWDEAIGTEDTVEKETLEPQTQEENKDNRDVVDTKEEDKPTKEEESTDDRDVVLAQDKPSEEEETKDDKVDAGAKDEDKPIEEEQSKDPSSPHERTWDEAIGTGDAVQEGLPEPKTEEVSVVPDVIPSQAKATLVTPPPPQSKVKIRRASSEEAPMHTELPPTEEVESQVEPPKSLITKDVLKRNQHQTRALETEGEEETCQAISPVPEKPSMPEDDVQVKPKTSMVPVLHPPDVTAITTPSSGTDSPLPTTVSYQQEETIVGQQAQVHSQDTKVTATLPSGPQPTMSFIEGGDEELVEETVQLFPSKAKAIVVPEDPSPTKVKVTRKSSLESKPLPEFQTVDKLEREVKPPEPLIKTDPLLKNQQQVRVGTTGEEEETLQTFGPTGEKPDRPADEVPSRARASLVAPPSCPEVTASVTPSAGEGQEPSPLGDVKQIGEQRSNEGVAQPPVLPPTGGPPTGDITAGKHGSTLPYPSSDQPTMPTVPQPPHVGVQLPPPPEGLISSPWQYNAGVSQPVHDPSYPPGAPCAPHLPGQASNAPFSSGPVPDVAYPRRMVPDAPYPSGPAPDAPYPPGLAFHDPYPPGLAPSSSGPVPNAPYPPGPALDAPYPPGPAPNAPYPPGPVPDAPYPSGPTSDAPYPPGPASDAPYPSGPSSDAPYPPGPSSDPPYPPGPVPDAPYPFGPVPNAPYPPASVPDAPYPPGPSSDAPCQSGPAPYPPTSTPSPSPFYTPPGAAFPYPGHPPQGVSSGQEQASPGSPYPPPHPAYPPRHDPVFPPQLPQGPYPPYPPVQSAYPPQPYPPAGDMGYPPPQPATQHPGQPAQTFQTGPENISGEAQPDAVLPPAPLPPRPPIGLDLVSSSVPSGGQQPTQNDLAIRETDILSPPYVSDQRQPFEGNVPESRESTDEVEKPDDRLSSEKLEKRRVSFETQNSKDIQHSALMSPHDVGKPDGRLSSDKLEKRRVSFETQKSKDIQHSAPMSPPDKAVLPWRPIEEKISPRPGSIPIPLPWSPTPSPEKQKAFDFGGAPNVPSESEQIPAELSEHKSEIPGQLGLSKAEEEYQSGEVPSGFDASPGKERAPESNVKDDAAPMSPPDKAVLPWRPIEEIISPRPGSIAIPLPWTPTPSPEKQQAFDFGGASRRHVTVQEETVEEECDQGQTKQPTTTLISDTESGTLRTSYTFSDQDKPTEPEITTSEEAQDQSIPMSPSDKGVTPTEDTVEQGSDHRKRLPATSSEQAPTEETQGRLDKSEQSEFLEADEEYDYGAVPLGYGSHDKDKAPQSRIPTSKVGHKPQEKEDTAKDNTSQRPEELQHSAPMSPPDKAVLPWRPIEEIISPRQGSIPIPLPWTPTPSPEIQQAFDFGRAPRRDVTAAEVTEQDRDIQTKQPSKTSTSQTLSDQIVPSESEQIPTEVSEDQSKISGQPGFTEFQSGVVPSGYDISPSKERASESKVKDDTSQSTEQDNRVPSSPEVEPLSPTKPTKIGSKEQHTVPTSPPNKAVLPWEPLENILSPRPGSIAIPLPWTPTEPHEGQRLFEFGGATRRHVSATEGVVEEDGDRWTKLPIETMVSDTKTGALCTEYTLTDQDVPTESEQMSTEAIEDKSTTPGQPELVKAEDEYQCGVVPSGYDTDEKLQEAQSAATDVTPKTMEPDLDDPSSPEVEPLSPYKPVRPTHKPVTKVTEKSPQTKFFPRKSDSSSESSRLSSSEIEPVTPESPTSPPYKAVVVWRSREEILSPRISSVVIPLPWSPLPQSPTRSRQLNRQKATKREQGLVEGTTIFEEDPGMTKLVNVVDIPAREEVALSTAFVPSQPPDHGDVDNELNRQRAAAGEPGWVEEATSFEADPSMTKVANVADVSPHEDVALAAAFVSSQPPQQRDGDNEGDVFYDAPDTASSEQPVKQKPARQSKIPTFQSKSPPHSAKPDEGLTEQQSPDQPQPEHSTGPFQQSPSPSKIPIGPSTLPTSPRKRVDSPPPPPNTPKSPIRKSTSPSKMPSAAKPSGIPTLKTPLKDYGSPLRASSPTDNEKDATEVSEDVPQTEKDEREPGNEKEGQDVEMVKDEEVHGVANLQKPDQLRDNQGDPDSVDDQTKESEDERQGYEIPEDLERIDEEDESSRSERGYYGDDDAESDMSEGKGWRGRVLTKRSSKEDLLTTEEESEEDVKAASQRRLPPKTLALDTSSTPTRWPTWPSPMSPADKALLLWKPREDILSPKPGSIVIPLPWSPTRRPPTPMTPKSRKRFHPPLRQLQKVLKENTLDVGPLPAWSYLGVSVIPVTTSCIVTGFVLSEDSRRSEDPSPVEVQVHEVSAHTEDDSWVMVEESDDDMAELGAAGYTDREQDKEAFVTLVTNDSYSFGALVLGQSLRAVHTTRKLAILVTPLVSDSIREQLGKVYDDVHVVDVVDSGDTEKLALLSRPELGITFTKLHCWRLTNYTKAVFLDADTLVLRNVDDLFDKEELSAVPDIGWPDCFNSGVFVFRPSEDTYQALLQCATTTGSFDGGDQGLLNTFFSDWGTKDISRHLSFLYNMTSTIHYSYLPAFNRFGGEVKIVHFIGPIKPWHHQYNTSSGTVKPHPNQDSSLPLHHMDFLQAWWDVFMNRVKPLLEGQGQILSGDHADDTQDITSQLAQLQVQSVERPAYVSSEDHRRAWERGEIDFTGLDRFENIQKKLDAQMKT